MSPTVAVITGASSGIGRATALRFARAGETVAVLARSGKALEELAEECGSVGGKAVTIAVDVSDEAAMKAAADMVIERFGEIDVWINNASIDAFGRLEEVPSELCRRVVDVNLMGCIHGARAVLPHFREQGKGVLINIASVAGVTGEAYSSIYAATKAGIIGLSNSLRQEVYDAPKIHVCTVLPASIDTPVFQHAANYMGRRPKPIKPVYPATLVAEAIFRLAHHPHRQLVVGGAGRMAVSLHKKLPKLVEVFYARKSQRSHFLDVGALPTDGSAFEPMEGFHTISGGWNTGPRRTASLKPVFIAALAAAAGYFTYEAVEWYQSRKKSVGLRHRVAAMLGR